MNELNKINYFKDLFGVLKIWLLAGLITVNFTSCKKFTDVVAPTTSITGASVFTSDATAIAVLTGMYAKISNSALNTYGTLPSLTFASGLSSDEFNLSTAVTDATAKTYNTNALFANGSAAPGSEFWSNFYGYIFQCNAAIEGLNASNSLTPAVKQQLLGEAKFLRALFYFYLVNLYGDVPLALTSDYKVNAVLARTPKLQVYQQIISDLKEAQSLLSQKYLDASLLNSYGERVRPTSWAATALLARTYLYLGNLGGDASNYTDAEAQATTLISNTGTFILSTLAKTFVKYSLGNNEAIWQLQPVNTGWNTEDAKAFVVTNTGPATPGGLNLGALSSANLINAFESGDNRKINWIGNINLSGTTYYFPFKYKIYIQNQPVNEYLTVFRLGEQYLIRAEARAQLGENTAANDLNAIRNRAGLVNYAGATDKTSLLAAILHERQVELFAEFGHRWLDLKRTGKVDAVMGSPGGATAVKGGRWSSYQQLYPLPLGDLQLNVNLKQNPEY